MNTTLAIGSMPAMDRADHPAHDGGGGAIAEEADAHDRQQVGRYIKNGCCQ